MEIPHSAGLCGDWKKSIGIIFHLQTSLKHVADNPKKQIELLFRQQIITQVTLKYRKLFESTSCRNFCISDDGILNICDLILAALVIKTNRTFICSLIT